MAVGKQLAARELGRSAPSELSMENEEEITRELGSGERLLWSGRPRQGLLLRSSDIFTIPFSMLWCGFAFYWEFGVVTSNAPIFFVLWGIPFIVLGLYLVFGRFLVESAQRRRTYYGVTEDRVIIASGLFTRGVKSLNLRTLTDISLTERPDRSGTITFGQGSGFSWLGTTSWPSMGAQAPTFDTIENAKEVYNRIRVAQKENTW